MVEGKKLIPLKQAAELVNVHKDTLRRAIKSEKLKGYPTPGGWMRVDEDELRRKYL